MTVAKHARITFGAGCARHGVRRRICKVLAAAVAGFAINFSVLPSYAGTATSSSDRQIENAGTAIAISMPIAAGGISLLHDQDWSGVLQMGVSTGLTVGSALILKQ